MKKSLLLPRFHSEGSPKGDFYVLAFVKGLYVPPSEKTKDEAFLILNYSPTKAFTKFSFAIKSFDHRLRAYTRGINEHDTLEAALLTAWYEYKVAPHFWTPFPGQNLVKSNFGNKRKHAQLYSETRAQFCSLLQHFRHFAWSQSEGFVKRFGLKRPMKSLFRFKDIPTISDPLELNVENEEISQAAFNFFNAKKRQQP